MPVSLQETLDALHGGRVRSALDKLGWTLERRLKEELKDLNRKIIKVDLIKGRISKASPPAAKPRLRGFRVLAESDEETKFFWTERDQKTRQLVFERLHKLAGEFPATKIDHNFPGGLPGSGPDADSPEDVAAMMAAEDAYARTKYGTGTIVKPGSEDGPDLGKPEGAE